MTINDNEYKMLSYLVKKYFQEKVNEVNLGDYLLKDNYSEVVDEIATDVKEHIISNIDGIIWRTKNGLLYEDKIARIVERRRN